MGVEGISKVREVFLKTGALDYSNKKAVEYTDKSRKIIPNITNNSKWSKLLEQMCEYLVQRTN